MCVRVCNSAATAFVCFTTWAYLNGFLSHLEPFIDTAETQETRCSFLLLQDRRFEFVLSQVRWWFNLFQLEFQLWIKWLLTFYIFQYLSISFYPFVWWFTGSGFLYLRLVGLPGQICMDETTGVIRGCPLMERVAGCSDLSCEGIIWFNNWFNKIQ